MDPRGKLPEGKPASSNEVESLKSQLQEMQLETDILKETIEILKKDPGVDLKELKIREKAVIIGAIKGKYPLPLLLSRGRVDKILDSNRDRVGVRMYSREKRIKAIEKVIPKM